MSHHEIERDTRTNTRKRNALNAIDQPTKVYQAQDPVEQEQAALRAALHYATPRDREKRFNRGGNFLENAAGITSTKSMRT